MIAGARNRAGVGQPVGRLWSTTDAPVDRGRMLSRTIAEWRTWPWASILFLHVVYVMANYSSALVPYPNETTVSVDMFVAGSDTGMIGRRIGFLALALVSAVTLALRGRRVLRIRGVLGVLMLGYFALAASSYLWADDRGLVTRKLVVMVCVWLGALWAAARLGPRGILRLAFVSSVLTALTAIGIEVAAGRFQPWAGGYRLSGMQHPNATGQCVALGVVAAIALAGEGGISAAIYGCFALAGFAVLTMTGSRTSLFAATAAVAVYLMIIASRRRAVTWLLAAGVGVVVLGVCALTVFGIDVPTLLVDIVSFGRGDSDLKSLTLRTPLWHELITRYISARPFSGYGYASFWTERHIEQLSLGMHGFVYGHSHSGYLEMVLGIGIVGGAVHVMTILLAALRERRAFARTGVSACAFGTALLVGLLVGMIGEPLNLAVQLMPTFVAMSFIAHAAFVDDGASLNQSDAPSYS